MRRASGVVSVRGDANSVLPSANKHKTVTFSMVTTLLMFNMTMDFVHSGEGRTWWFY